MQPGRGAQPGAPGQPPPPAAFFPAGAPRATVPQQGPPGAPQPVRPSGATTPFQNFSPGGPQFRPPPANAVGRPTGPPPGLRGGPLSGPPGPPGPPPGVRGPVAGGPVSIAPRGPTGPPPPGAPLGPPPGRPQFPPISQPTPPPNFSAPTTPSLSVPPPPPLASQPLIPRPTVGPPTVGQVVTPSPSLPSGQLLPHGPSGGLPPPVFSAPAPPSFGLPKTSFPSPTPPMPTPLLTQGPPPPQQSSQPVPPPTFMPGASPQALQPGSFPPPPPFGGGAIGPPPIPNSSQPLLSQESSGFRPPGPAPPPAFGAGVQRQRPPSSSFAYPAAVPPQTTVPPPVDGFTAPGYSYPGSQLAEEFQSLTIQQAPGSLDAGLDPNSLPRPISTPDIPQITGPANANPRYVRLTTNVMPNAQSLRSRWHLPLGAVVHPLAEPPPGEEVPVVNFGPSGIVRCRRCRTYINPYVTFTDGGRRWRCNVCGLLNEVPVDYFCVLDANGRRQDADQRPELSLGSVEFEAPAEYMVRPPMPPVYFFLIDVSAAAAGSGMLQILAETVKACLDQLPGTSRTQVGFLTYDSTLHFYNLKASLSQPQMMVVAELDEPFLPLPDDLLVNLSESRTVVDAFLDSLPGMFRGNASIESALGPALKAAYMIMNHVGGKLLVFQSTLPSLGAGRLRLRGEDPRTYGTDREHTLRTTEDVFYKTLAADCSRVQMNINLYAFSDKYMDLASIGTLSKYTTGQVYYYPGFQAARDGEKFNKELARDLTRETGWEAVMRIRCGKGLKITTFHGHFFVRSIDLLALPAVDCDKAFAVQISHEETLLTTQTVYLQCAVLYTSSSGERRIRVHTVAIPVVADLGEMYRAADAGAIATLLGKLALDKALTSRLEDSRQLIQQKIIQGLKEYKALHQAQHRTVGRLIYPETLKLLPLFILGLCKSPALRGGFSEMAPDPRSWAMYELMSMPVSRTLKLIYPFLVRLDNMPPEAGKSGLDGKVVLPPALPLVTTSLDTRGAFLLDDGLRILVWLGKDLPSEWEAQLLGKEGASVGASIAPTGSEVSGRVMAIVEELRRGNGIHQQVVVTRPGDFYESFFFQGLMEERGQGTMSYADFIVLLYRQLQQK